MNDDMKMRYLGIRVVGIALLLLPLISAAQYRLDPASTMVIKGTSSLHDWSSDVTKMDGNLIVKSETGGPDRIEEFNLTIPVVSIKSDKNVMDNKTYEALKMKEFPEIRFHLDEVKSMTPDRISASGKLTIAGKSRDVHIESGYYKLSASKIELRGQKKIKMTDFAVEPPTALMGTLKTGDEVTVIFKVVLAK
jgi:polyisoprenoid-binding protein YceI